MKKFIRWFLCILILIFGLIIFVSNNDKKYNNKLKTDIINNTDIKKIKYINRYNGYYVVTDKYYIYLIDNEYNVILKKDINLIYKNINDYDIIYKDGYLMYFNNYIKDSVLVYEYYDINTYDIVDRVFVGGSIYE